MTPHGYYSFDIIQSNGEFKIIDIHGFGDAISFTERSKYHPRTERTRRFLSLIAEKTEGKKILILTESNEQMYKLPSNVLNFIQTLPKELIHFDWINEQKEKREIREIQTAQGKPLLVHQEDYALREAAKKLRLDLDYGFLNYYDSEFVCYDKLQKQSINDINIKVPHKDIGFILNWGSLGTGGANPLNSMFWENEQITHTHNTLCTPAETIILSGPTPKWMTRLLFSLNDTDSDFPYETTIGMGTANKKTLSKFINNLLDNPNIDTTNPNTIVAVSKPIMTHSGVDIKYHTLDDLLSLKFRYSNLSKEIILLNKLMRKQTYSGFPDSNEENIWLYPYETSDTKNILYPILELGTKSLQEYINPDPVLSTTTGKYHQGVIRAQILFGQPIGVMHRFSVIPYEKGSQAKIASQECPTFFERTSEELETEIVNFLLPHINSFEDEVKNANPLYVEEFRLEIAKEALSLSGKK